MTNTSEQKARQRQQECYLELVDKCSEILVEYYGKEVITLKELTHILAPLVTTTLLQHIDNIPSIETKKQKAEAILEVSGAFRELLKFLTDSTANQLINEYLIDDKGEIGTEDLKQMNKYTNLRKLFAQTKQDNNFNKKLYDSDIIQTLHERINELEDRIMKLEGELEKK